MTALIIVSCASFLAGLLIAILRVGGDADTEGDDASLYLVRAMWREGNADTIRRWSA